MRFHIHATVDVADPDGMLCAARTHAAAWEATSADDPYTVELVADPTSAIASALTNVLDFGAAAEIADREPGGSEWAALLRTLDGPVLIEVTDASGNSAEFHLGDTAALTAPAAARR